MLKVGETIRVLTRPWLVRIFRPVLPGMLALCLGTGALALIQVGVALLIGWVLDAGMAGDGQFLVGSALLLLLLGLQVLGRTVANFWADTLSDRQTARLRHEFLRAAEGASGERLQHYHSGTLLNRAMEDVRILCDGMIGALPALVGSLIRLLAAFCAIAAQQPLVGAVLLGAGAAVLVGTAVLRSLMREHHRRVREAEEEAASTMQEYLRQVELLQSMGAEEESLVRYRNKLDRGLALKARRRLFSEGARGLLGAVIQFGTGLLIIWGGWNIKSGQLSYGDLVSLIQLLSLFRNPILGLSGLWGRLVSMEVSAGRLGELMEEQERPAAHQHPTRAYALVFDHVTFSYENDPPVLEDFSARFDLNTWTCLTGFSGRGKTTLFRLMLGLFTPDSGRIYLETDLGPVLCGPETRRFFAYVPQDFALFSGSVLENLLLAAPEATWDDCCRALERAGAEFIFSMPDGLETAVREQGSGLSMGQFQRLAIARALVMERPVLLLDECTSALDAETELAVLTSLRGTGGGALAVTHHPEVLEGLAGVATFALDGVQEREEHE